MTLIELLMRADADRLDETGARDVTRFLAVHGLVAEPSPFTILAEAGEPRWSGRYDDPGLVVDEPVLRETFVTVRSTPRPALQAVLLLTIVLASIGFYRWPPYAGVVAAAGIATGAALALRFSAVGQRLPPAVPRGRALGAALALGAIGAAVILFAAARRATGL